jgi:hypothetical protein
VLARREDAPPQVAARQPASRRTFHPHPHPHPPPPPPAELRKDKGERTAGGVTPGSDEYYASVARVEEPAVKPLVAPAPAGVAAPVDRRTQAPPPQQQLAPPPNPAFARHAPAPASPGSKPEAHLTRPQAFKSAVPEPPSTHMIPASYGSAPSSNPYGAPAPSSNPYGSAPSSNPEAGRAPSGYGGGGYQDSSSSSSRPASGYGAAALSYGYGAPPPEMARGGPSGGSAAAAPPAFEEEDELLNARNELMETIMEDEEALINAHRWAGLAARRCLAPGAVLCARGPLGALRWPWCLRGGLQAAAGWAPGGGGAWFPPGTAGTSGGRVQGRRCGRLPPASRQPRPPLPGRLPLTRLRLPRPPQGPDRAHHGHRAPGDEPADRGGPARQRDRPVR